MQQQSVCSCDVDCGWQGTEEEQRKENRTNNNAKTLGNGKTDTIKRNKEERKSSFGYKNEIHTGHAKFGMLVEHQVEYSTGITVIFQSRYIA